MDIDGQNQSWLKMLQKHCSQTCNPKFEEITKLLNDGRYAGSKDWREGDLVERVYWLLSSYESKVSECNMLWQMLEETQNGER